ncbi:S41 family peptidase [Luteimonas salinilitoris]
MRFQSASRRSSFWLLVALWTGTPSPVHSQQIFSPEQLRADLDVIRNTIDRAHPDPAHSADEAALTHAFARIRRCLDDDMTRDQAWAQLAILNPVLADGHLLVGYPDWREDSLAHLAGKGFFPFEVHVDPADGQPFIRSKLGGGATDLAGARIERIDGRDARRVTRALLARVHGDTPAFRAELLSRRWWFFYWKRYGDEATYDLELTQPEASRIVVPASRETPALLANEASFDRQFRFELLPGNTALLTIGGFGWHDEARYYDFTRSAFRRMRDAGVRTLIIDLRANGGGDDTFWRQGLLPYIATKPYTWGSRYRKRVVEKYRDEGERVGDVVHGTITTWILPEPDNPLHFAGDTYVLVGASTYSSAILFVNVMQDFGFGAIAGTGGSARSTQSGGVERFTLPNTGLAVWVPRFVLARPSGALEPMMLQPDIPLRENPLQPRAAVETLLSKLRLEDDARRRKTGEPEPDADASR